MQATQKSFITELEQNKHIVDKSATVSAETPVWEALKAKLQSDDARQVFYRLLFDEKMGRFRSRDMWPRL